MSAFSEETRERDCDLQFRDVLPPERGTVDQTVYLDAFGDLLATGKLREHEMKEFIMNNITKKTAFGLTGAAAAALLVTGFAAPAMADDISSSDHYSSTSSTNLADLFRVGDVSNDSPIVLAPSVGTGDVLSGNAVASGNDVTAPVASGNETSVGNVSDIGNGTSVSGGDIGANVDDLVDGGNIGTNVDNLVGDILADLGIED